MLLKKEGEESFKIQDYQKACDRYKEALTEIESIFDESKPELKVEGAKVASNISFMYLKLSKEQNDESLLLESKKYAKKSISHNPAWIKGYLWLADVCKQIEDEDDILNAIALYLQDNKVLTDQFQSLLEKVKYYTHKNIMMLSPSWHLVKYKTNVFVIDPLGAGHFKDFEEFLNCHGKCIENISLLVRPGTYVGYYVLINATIDIVGDCSIEINSKTKAIDKNPTVLFTNCALPHYKDLNALNNNSRTFFFINSKVILKRITVYGETVPNPYQAISCENTDIKLLECAFYSKGSDGLFGSSGSKLNCKSCRSVNSWVGVATGKDSDAKLTDCFFSEIGQVGIVAKDEADMMSIKHCTITNCKRQGLLIFQGAKKAKVVDSYFEGNCSLKINIGAIHFRSCRALVKNTSIRSENAICVLIEGGSANFDNIVIEDCAIGMAVKANVELTNSIVNACSVVGVQIDIKGNIVLEDNVITNCCSDISRTLDSPMPIFKGKERHGINTLPHMDVFNEMIYKEIRNSRKKGSDGSIVGPMYDDFIDKSGLNKGCNHCGLTESQLKGSSKSLKICSKCKSKYYCSSECQQKGWKLHKPHCESFVRSKLKANEQMKYNQSDQINAFNIVQGNMKDIPQHYRVVNIVGGQVVDSYITSGMSAPAAQVEEVRSYISKKVNGPTAQVEEINSDDDNSAATTSNVPEWKRKNKKKNKKGKSKF